MSAQIQASDGSNQTPIVFTHYGISEYLPITLRQAKLSNPNKRCILIGDKTNKVLADDAGWEHFEFVLLKSSIKDEFNSVFRWVQGKLHNPVRGGQDWLRYVSERFFAIDVLFTNISKDLIWHFDSDTMIMVDLAPYEQRFINSRLACTTLCNDQCPSGLLRAQLVREFCLNMIKQYRDTSLLERQQREFDSINPMFAFTEMRSFNIFRETAGIKTARLSTFYSDQWVWFDDCICNSHGLEFKWADKSKRCIKNIFHDDQKIYIMSKSAQPFLMATVNCSWVPLDVFQWLDLAYRKRPVAKYLVTQLKLPLHRRIVAYAKQWLFTRLIALRQRLSQ
jgi:hypothetical protein